MEKERKLTKEEERKKARYPETAAFLWENANSGRKFTNDCVVRAISTATGQTWEDTARGLFEFMLKTHKMLNDPDCYIKYLDSIGWVKHAQPRKYDDTKYTGAEWCAHLSMHDPNGAIGPIIAHIGGHHIVCIKPTNHGDGFNCRYKILDTWDSSEKCIGNYWAPYGRFLA